MCIRKTVLGHIQHAKAGYFVQVWLVRRPKQTQSASTPMYNIVMTFLLLSYYAETVRRPSKSAAGNIPSGASAVAVAVARSPSYHQSLQSGLDDVDM